MPEGTPSAFDEFSDGWTQESDPLVDPETPEAPTAQPATEPPAPAPAEAPTSELVGEEPAGEEPKLYAGKYTTPEELERAYGEAQTLIHRQGEERNRALMEAAQVRETVATLGIAPREAAPIA